MEMRLANRHDMARLKEIWKLCFGDEEDYIEYFYRNRFNEDNTPVLIENGIIAAMLTILPVKVIQPGCADLEAGMFYGVATHPDYQNRGYAEELMNFSSKYLMERNVNITTLVPASMSLFDFYTKKGFQDGFYIRETVLTSGQIQQLADPPRVQRCNMTPISSEDYNHRREFLCKDIPHIAYSIKDIEFQKTMSRISGEDIYSVDFENFHGCLTVERISRERVMIKELLCPDELMYSVLHHMLKMIEAEEYIIRTPARERAVLGGEIRPFGMIRISSESKIVFTEEKTGYLGLAFD